MKFFLLSCHEKLCRPKIRQMGRAHLDTAVLADPVSNLHMIGVCVFGESGRLGLLRGKETLLLLGELEEPPRRFTVRLGQNTILQFY